MHGLDNRFRRGARRAVRRGLITLLGVAAGCSCGAAAADTWVAPFGDWFTAGNWADASVPSAADAVDIDNGGRAVVELASTNGPARSADIFVGDSGSGEVELRNAGRLESGYAYLGFDPGSSGAATVVDASTQWVCDGLLVAGYRGAATILVDRGAQILGTAGGSIGQAGGVGTVEINGAGSLWDSGADIYVGDAGTGTLGIYGGAKVSGPNKVTLALGTDSSGRLRLGRGGTAGVLQAHVVEGGAGDARVEFNHTADTGVPYFFTADGTPTGSPILIQGTATVMNTGSGTTVLTADNSYTGGTTISDGGLQLGNGGASGAIVGDVANNGLLSFNRAGSTTFTGVISGSGSVSHLGEGTTTFNAAHSYGGGTLVRNGTLVLDGGALNHTGASLVVGEQPGDDGTLRIGNGATVASSTGVIGGDSDWSGSATGVGEATVTGVGSSWTTDSYLYVGIDGTGTLNVTDGATVSCGSHCGTSGQTSGRGTINIDGTGSRLEANRSVSIGDSGPGVLNVTRGAAVSSDTGIIGAFMNGDAAVRLDGSGTSWQVNDYLLVGYHGRGDLSVTGGASLRNGYTVIGHHMLSGGATAVVAGEGSSWSSRGYMLLGGGTSADLTIADGGLVTVRNDSGNPHGAGDVVIADDADVAATLNIGRGGGAGVFATGSIEGGGGNATVNFDHADPAYHFTGDGTGAGTPVALLGNLTVNHLGTGTTILDGAHTYAGSTHIAAGTLQVDGSLVAPLTVASGGTLAGTGTVAAANVEAGGILAPGSDVGTLTSGNLSLSEGAVLAFELGVPEVVGGGVNDLVQVRGDLRLDGQLQVSDLGSMAPGRYTLFTYTGTLTDRGLAVGDLPPGLTAYVDTAPAGEVHLVTEVRRFTVTPTAGAHGGIAPAAPITVDYGARVEFVVTADPGRVATVTGTCGGTHAGTTFRTEPVHGDCTVVAEFPLEVVDGACGEAVQLPTLLAPIEGLCAGGEAGPLQTAAGKHTWQCVGSGGGDSASCEAPGATAAEIGGAGTVTLALTPTQPECRVDSAELVSPPEGGPAGMELPFGALAFTLGGCRGETVEVTATYSASTREMVYWKFIDGGWTTMPVTFTPNSATFLISDNGPYDSDPAPGIIRDPGGPGRVAAVPLLSPSLLVVLGALLVVAVGSGRRRGRR